MANEKLIYASAARKAILKADPKLAHCIDSVPGVDAVEVVHGRWTRVTAGYYECSNCMSHVAIFSGQKNYCPNCGAKMDGGNEDG